MLRLWCAALRPEPGVPRVPAESCAKLFLRVQVVLGLVLLQTSQEPAEGRTKLLGEAWRSLSAACLLQSPAANSGGAQALAAALLAQVEAAGNLRRKEERVAHHISQVRTACAPLPSVCWCLSSSSAVGRSLCCFMRVPPACKLCLD